MDGLEGIIWMYLIWQGIKRLPALFQLIGYILFILVLIALWPLWLVVEVFRPTKTKVIQTKPALEYDEMTSLHLTCACFWVFGFIIYFGIINP